MESSNAKKLRMFIKFLEQDELGADYRNVEKAAAKYLTDHFITVLSMADGMDEADRQLEFDREMKKEA